MKKEDDMEKKKIPHRLNEILIERIKKYQIQDFSQLINSPNDEDTNNSILGGLINFDVEKNDISDYEENNDNDLDKITVNDIYIEPYQYNDYEELNEEEEEEENLKNNNNIKYNFKNEENNNVNINVLINEDFNKYLDLIQKDYKKFENNHFPKLIVEKDDHKKKYIDNIRKKIYETKQGEKIVVNNDVYSTSLAYLKNKDIFYDMPPRYKRDETEFTLDYNLLEENMETIFMKSKEFIEMNSSLSTSMSKVLFYSNYLDKYINDKLEPFDKSINISFDKIQRDRQFISEIKTKTMKNSGNIILKRLKMNNTKKLIEKLQKYKNLKNKMDSLESLFSDPKKSQEIYKLIGVCKEEIEIIKNKNNTESNCESIIELFEQKLNEYKSRNDAHLSGELSQVIYNYFNNFITIGNEKEINNTEKIEEYEKYGISKFVLEKIYSNSEFYSLILNNINIPSPKEELEKISKICEYYIEGNLMSNIFLQLRGIFIVLGDQIMEQILTIFNGKLNNKANAVKKENKSNENESKENENKESVNKENENKENENKGKERESEDNENKKENDKKDEENEEENENDSKKENENTETENTENEKENEIINEKLENNEEMPIKEENKDNDKIFILLCILLSKNKLNETILSFIDIILSKVENSEIIDKILKENIVKECKEIKTILQENIKNIIKEQIQKCLNNISKNDNLDKYINNYYFVLEMIKNEIPKYDLINPETKMNDNKLIKIIIKEQKNFIEQWAKNNVERFETNLYKSWETLKEIPQQYQNYLDVFFTFDIESNCMKDEALITKFPSEKINLIKESLEEVENNQDNEENKPNKGLLFLKDGDKPELRIKINQTGLYIINFAFEVLKMFTLFHKECYGNILGNVAVLIISHLNYQIDQIYSKEKKDFNITQLEVSMTYSIFLLIQYIYEHIKESDFIVEIAKNSKQKLIDSYFEIAKNINIGLEKSKTKIKEMLEENCINKSLNKLYKIEMPNYSMETGVYPVKEYTLIFVGSLQDIYKSMLNSYEDSFIIEMVNKALEEFLDKFEEFIFHGEKIEDENCLRQFKKDMIFLKKNTVFINILDLTDFRNRIDQINKSVLPEWLLKAKKK